MERKNRSSCITFRKRRAGRASEAPRPARQGATGPKGVVPGDEGTRASGERSTTRCPAAAQPDAGGLKVRTGGVGMGSNPSAAVGSSDSIPAQLQ